MKWKLRIEFKLVKYKKKQQEIHNKNCLFNVGDCVESVMRGSVIGATDRSKTTVRYVASTAANRR